MPISISDYVHGTSTIITEASVSEDGQILLMAGDGLAYMLNPVCAIRLSNQLRDATHLALQELHDEMGGK